MSNRYAVILAGGRGKRLWPVSTDTLPKQFLKLAGERTLLQATFDRISSFIDVEKIRVSVPDEFRPLAEKQLPNLNKASIIVEPEVCNTAPGIALASILIQREDPDAVIGVFPVDHYIPAEYLVQFQNDLKTAYDFAAANDQIVTIGMEPLYPSAAYGYLEYDPGQKSGLVYKIENYLEKPALSIAEKLINGSRCFWNGGIFVFHAGVFIEALGRCLPQTYNILKNLPAVDSVDYHSRLRADYGRTDKISIDRGVMEKTKNIYAVKAGYKRVDLGNFEVLGSLWQSDKDQNRGQGNILFIDSRDCISYADSGRVILHGCDGIAVLQAGNNIIVCPKEKLMDLDKIKELADGK